MICDEQVPRTGNRLSQQIAGSTGAVERESYAVNSLDQVTQTASGGAVHVAGSLSKPGLVSGVQSVVPTGAGNAFAAWIGTSSLTSATVYAEDWSSQTAAQAVSVSAIDVPKYDYTYDANGNVTKVVRTETDGVTQHETDYKWDADDRLVEVTTPDCHSVFTYDGLGRRVKIVDTPTVGAASTHYYLWEGMRIIEDRGAISGINTANNQAKYFFSNGQYQEYGDLNVYYTRDHLGSIRQIFDANTGELQDSYTYDAYGNATAAYGSLDDSEFLYTGHFHHNPSGLYLAPYRAYDPRIGKWLSREPFGLDGPNLYNYTLANPLSFVDHNGLAADINLMNPSNNSEDRPSYDYGNSPAIPNRPNIICVFGHGNSSGVYGPDPNNPKGSYIPISSDDLAQRIKNNPKYPNATLIQLLSCDVGEGSYPQDLANSTGLPVTAGVTSIWFMPEGPRYFPADPRYPGHIGSHGQILGERPLLSCPGHAIPFFPRKK